VTRIQLSLFVPQPQAAALDALRSVLDPVQHRLIGPHVTLCREDELAVVAVDVLLRHLATISLPPLTLEFGAPQPFDGHGILLPCVAGESEFAALRQYLLGTRVLRRQPPHLTLAHPRNVKAPGNSLAFANTLSVPMSVTFGQVHRIEQATESPWRVLDTFTIPAS
jgi:hypothetical protein